MYFLYENCLLFTTVYCMSMASLVESIITQPIHYYVTIPVDPDDVRLYGRDRLRSRTRSSARIGIFGIKVQHLHGHIHVHVHDCTGTSIIKIRM